MSSISSALLADVKKYLDKYFIDDGLPDEAAEGAEDVQMLEIKCFNVCEEEDFLFKDVQAEKNSHEKPAKERSLSDLLDEADDTFSESLLRLIDTKGKTDPEVYKRANIDRRHFSKIRNTPDYQPSKNTALALAIALELNLDEAKDFIGRAGYALSHSSKTDIIVEYFITREEYDILTINETLFAFGQPCLG